MEVTWCDGRDVTGSDIIATGSHVVWGGKPRTRREKECGRRSDKERTGRDADMTSPLARVGNRRPQAGKIAGSDQTKEDAMLDKTKMI